MIQIQAVLNEFMPCGGTVCPGCEVACTSGDGRTPDVDRMADAILTLRAELTQAKLLKPLHPATIDDAIALLVREGYRQETWYDDSTVVNGPRLRQFLNAKDMTKPVRVLIAPTPERAS